MLRLVIFSILWSLCSTANAWTAEYGPFKVSKLKFGLGGVYAAFDPAPASCGGGDHYRMHAKVNKSDADNYKDMVSALIAANSTGQRLEWIWVNSEGECNAENILILEMFEFSER